MKFELFTINPENDGGLEYLEDFVEHNDVFTVTQSGGDRWIYVIVWYKD